MDEVIAAILLVGSAAAADAEGPVQSVLAHLKTDPQVLPWYTWLWVVGIGLVGWGASSAATLAGWIDPEAGKGDGNHRKELWNARWAIIGRLIACLAAGLAAFFGGLLMGTPMVANFLAVLFAAYGGDKYLQMKAEQQASKGP